MYEAYFVQDRHEKDTANAHLVLAAKTKKGIGDLNETISESYFSGFYYRPRIDIDLLFKLDPRDVFCTTACVGGVFKYGYEQAEQLIQAMRQHFGDSFMLEVQMHNTEKQKEVNNFLLRMYRKYKIPLIMGVDSHVIYQEQEELRTLRLEANNIRYEGEEGWQLWYPDRDEIVRAFQTQGVLSAAQIEEAIDNTLVFLDFDDVKVDRSRKIPNIYPHMTEAERNDMYRRLVLEGYEANYGDTPADVKAKEMAELEYEMNTITETNTSDYFLTLVKIIEEGKKRGGVLTRTGRGSAASYATNRMLGLTSVNRLRTPVTFYPDRFISKDRLATGAIPDLDANVGNQVPFAEAGKAILGEWGCVPMVAFGKLGLASAWKMYARAEKVPFAEANEVSAALASYERALRYAANDDDESGNDDDTNPEDIVPLSDYIPEKYLAQVEASKRYHGIVDNVSPHPCAYLLFDGDIRREIGVIRLKDKGGKQVYGAIIDGTTADKCGYVKLDALNVDVVRINDDAYRLAGIPQPAASELIAQTQGDQAVWRMYHEGFTLGLNQCEKPKTTERIKRYKPRNVVELSAFVAAIRPSFQSMLEPFLSRQKFRYDIPALDNVLQTPEMKSSYLIYQEQIFTILMTAGISGPDAYRVIKGISKKDMGIIHSFMDKFIDGFVPYVMSDGKTSKPEAERIAAEVWRVVEDSASYGFNACVTGNTRIMTVSDGKESPTVREMWDAVHDRDSWPSDRMIALRKKYARSYGKGYSRKEDGTLVQNRIVDIRKAGVQDIYRLTLANGAKIECTLDHAFPTPAGPKRLGQMSPGDLVYISTNTKPVVADRATTAEVYRRKHDAIFSKPKPVYQKFRGKRAWTETSQVMSITHLRREMTYDVEMSAPYHNFEVSTGIITSNSHAYCVALDSLYSAYLKAYHPYEFYVAAMRVYGEKGHKDKLAKLKVEMRQAFGIAVQTPRFGEDSRDFFINKESKTISDALPSVKHMSKTAAQTLFDLSGNQYQYFVELLHDILFKGGVNSRQIDILIKMGYFRDFGNEGKLLAIYNEFSEGKNKVYKTLSPATILKRLDFLRDLEDLTDGEPMTHAEKLKFELQYIGAPISVYPDKEREYIVLEVDTAYSPKIDLYSVARGTTGRMKIRKQQYNTDPLKPGDAIVLVDWDRSPAYAYVNGKPVKKQGEFDMWIRHFERVL